MSIITELQGSWFPKEKIPACPLYICRWFWSLSLLILILCSTSNLTKAFAKYGVEHRIRNLSQDILRMCRDRASKLRFFKFFASNENERCLVHRPSIVNQITRCREFLSSEFLLINCVLLKQVASWLYSFIVQPSWRNGSSFKRWPKPKGYIGADLLVLHTIVEEPSNISITTSWALPSGERRS